METADLQCQNDIRTLLKEELHNRCRRNPKYSLRSFARALEIEPSFLSKLLSGKRNFTPRLIGHLTEKIDSIRVVPPETDFKDFGDESFHLLRDWYNLALLELLEVKDFQSDPRWMAKVLGVSVLEIKMALERMEATGFIKRDGDRWKNISGQHTTVSKPTTTMLRALQKKILEQAHIALDEVPSELRDQSSITMAIDTSLLPEAKEKIKKFRRSLNRFLQSNRKTNEVYQLSISLFPVTQIKQRK